MGDPSNSLTYWQALARAADEGHLFLDAQAASACSAACDEYIGKLRGHQSKADELGNVSGWGDFASGKDYQRILSEKAVGGDNNMVDVLQSHIDVVEEMKSVFNKFFTATQAVDDATAAEVGAQGPN